MNDYTLFVAQLVHRYAWFAAPEEVWPLIDPMIEDVLSLEGYPADVHPVVAEALHLPAYRDWSWGRQRMEYAAYVSSAVEEFKAVATTRDMQTLIDAVQEKLSACGRPVSEEAAWQEVDQEIAGRLLIPTFGLWVSQGHFRHRRN